MDDTDVHEIVVDLITRRLGQLSIPDGRISVSWWRDVRPREVRGERSFTTSCLASRVSDDRLMTVRVLDRLGLSCEVVRDVDAEKTVIRVQDSLAVPSSEVQRPCDEMLSWATQVASEHELLSGGADGSRVFDIQREVIHPMADRVRWSVADYCRFVSCYYWTTFVGERLSSLLGAPSTPVSDLIADRFPDGSGGEVTVFRASRDPGDPVVLDRLRLLRSHLRPLLHGWMVPGERPHAHDRLVEGPPVPLELARGLADVMNDERRLEALVAAGSAEASVRIDVDHRTATKMVWSLRPEKDMATQAHEFLLGALSALGRAITDGWYRSDTELTWEPDRGGRADQIWTTRLSVPDATMSRLVALVFLQALRSSVTTSEGPRRIVRTMTVSGG